MFVPPFRSLVIAFNLWQNQINFLFLLILLFLILTDFLCALLLFKTPFSPCVLLLLFSFISLCDYPHLISEFRLPLFLPLFLHIHLSYSYFFKTSFPFLSVSVCSFIVFFCDYFLPISLSVPSVLGRIFIFMLLIIC